jgi:hypothetical protein
MDAFTAGYIETVEWLLDDECQAADGFADETIRRMESDCARFQAENEEAIEEYLAASGRTLGSAGHDFWLTRNHHGAGFWDRGLPGDLGKRLTDAAHAYGSCDAYAGDDGMLYLA